MRYLTISEVCDLNRLEVGEGNLADFGLIEAAVLRPQQTVGGADAYPDVHAKAGALLHSLARNHGFVDGNKRTAALGMLMFYRFNGYAIRVEQGDLVALITDAAEGLIDAASIAGVLKDWAQPVNLDGVREY